jgi:hypothetical protein
MISYSNTLMLFTEAFADEFDKRRIVFFIVLSFVVCQHGQFFNFYQRLV